MTYCRPHTVKARPPRWPSCWWHKHTRPSSLQGCWDNVEKRMSASACVFYGLLKVDELQSEVSDALTTTVNPWCSWVHLSVFVRGPVCSVSVCLCVREAVFTSAQYEVWKCFKLQVSYLCWWAAIWSLTLMKAVHSVCACAWVVVYVCNCSHLKWFSVDSL